MTAPRLPPEPSAYAVACRTCQVTVWQGNELVETDGQVLLTAYADSTPGPRCPSGVAACPHTTAAVADRARSRPATVADLDDIRDRIDRLERGGPP